MIRVIEKEDINEIYNIFGEKNTDYTLVTDTIIDNDFSNPNVVLYGEDEDGVIKSILLHNGGNLTYYATEIRSIEPYRSMLMELDYFKISCETRFIEGFKEVLGKDNIENSRFGYVCRPVTHREDIDSRGLSFECLNESPELISNDYFEELISADPGIVERAKNVSNSPSQRIFCLSAEGKAIASAMIVVEQSRSVIIHGVLTAEYKRRQGLSHYLLATICNDLLEKGKYTYFFYVNPAARELFLNMGMDEVGEWSILYLA